ncbi:two-component system response regulator [Scytonema hofmannii PCC 7110]|uniref:Protein PatA n=1 Tax=Scytonema hofmannii PCC 7110 TaxID=128403 RepID=A0A139XCS1_9CYAN|nr:response regulator [Scytonema hofmannii]KYC42490.1 two-component system response regulator [Scytonema hofmannii PCC 7110]
MNKPELLVSNTLLLLSEFKACTQLQFNGKLDIRNTEGQTWTFFYQLGRIVWATGGLHPLRRWYRQMARYCPDLNIQKIQLLLEDISKDDWDYRLLGNLYKTEKIQREQIKTIVENTIAELLFDAIQQANFASVSCERNPATVLEALFSSTGVDISMKLMQDSWQTWLETGLEMISPNLAPILKKPEQLQYQVSASIYKNFITLLNGKSTLRDLAVKMKQSVLPLTRSLFPYIQKGMIELIQVPDLPLQVSGNKNKLTVPSIKSTAPLIACVDDSPQVCQMLEGILLSHGLRCVKIEDSVQALPILIQSKPELIFLDLVMPVANGYEICGQLRRISIFADTPVIILTSSDGVFDRVRAKVAGCTDFITKPIVANKVIAIAQKYLQTPSFNN